MFISCAKEAFNDLLLLQALQKLIRYCSSSDAYIWKLKGPRQLEHMWQSATLPAYDTNDSCDIGFECHTLNMFLFERFKYLTSVGVFLSSMSPSPKTIYSRGALHVLKQQKLTGSASPALVQLEKSGQDLCGAPQLLLQKASILLFL